MARDDRLPLMGNTAYRLDYARYEGKTDAEKRRIIKKLLDISVVGVNAVLLDKQEIEAKVGGVIDEASSQVALDGIVYVRAYYDGTDKTGKIQFGKPVVFDTVTGACVTGIDESWGPDEYKVMGVALATHEESMTEPIAIPVRLRTDSALSRGAKLFSSGSGIDRAAYSGTGEFRLEISGAQQMKTVRKADGTPPNETDIRYVLEVDESAPLTPIKNWSTRSIPANVIFLAVPEEGTEYYLPNAINLG